MLCGFEAKNLIKMTDKEIYERFMLWMGMKPSKTKQIDANKVVEVQFGKPFGEEVNALIKSGDVNIGTADKTPAYTPSKSQSDFEIQTKTKIPPSLGPEYDVQINMILGSWYRELFCHQMGPC